mgnify:CR=1 FL=1
MKMNMHYVAVADRALGYEANTDDEEATIDEVLAEMSTRWHSPCCLTE